MIAGFDHVVIAVRDLDQGVAAYEALLGRACTERSTSDGAATALIATSNTAVELMAPHGEGETAQRLRAALESGEGLKSLVFAVDDIERVHRRAERTGLAPQPISEQETWRSFRADSACTNGARFFFLQRTAPLRVEAVNEGSVIALDHIVIRSSGAERAAALYGARLGLDLRLDREVGGQRLLFFRCGDAIVEIVCDASVTSDTLWGLSWRVVDADAAQKRLEAAGFDVSGVRTGHKPGTRVFTVRNGACGVPTLMIETGG